MEEIEAIVKFDKLRNYLESIGIHVAEASADGYHAVKPGEVTLQAIKDGTPKGWGWPRPKSGSPAPGWKGSAAGWPPA